MSDVSGPFRELLITVVVIAAGLLLLLTGILSYHWGFYEGRDSMDRTHNCILISKDK